MDLQATVPNQTAAALAKIHMYVEGYREVEEEMMRRIVTWGAALVLSLVAIPAWAGVGNNPNAEFIADVACVDGTEAELVIAVGQAGHDPAGRLEGVATSIWILDGPNGDRLFPVFDRPGQGLDDLTTWCWWFDDTEGVWIGADILFHPSLR